MAMAIKLQTGDKRITEKLPHHYKTAGFCVPAVLLGIAMSFLGLSRQG